MENCIVRTQTALSCDAQTACPETIELLNLGQIHYTKGGEHCTLSLDESSAQAILDEFARRGRDLVIDYEHRSLSGEEAPAAGWIDRLFLSGTALCAHVKQWTQKACDYLQKGEYRYVSPVLMLENGVPCALHSLALTNHPALHNLAPLVASDQNVFDHEVHARVAQAFSDGKLFESQRAWAERTAREHPEIFSDFLAHAPVIAPLSCAALKNAEQLALNENTQAKTVYDPKMLRTLCGLNPEQIQTLTKECKHG